MGPLPISYQDIRAWSDVTGRWLAPWELDVVLRLDRTWLTSWAKGQEKAPKPKG